MAVATLVILLATVSSANSADVSSSNKAKQTNVANINKRAIVDYKNKCVHIEDVQCPINDGGHI
jgi:hypothetical protein